MRLESGKHAGRGGFRPRHAGILGAVAVVLLCVAYVVASMVAAVPATAAVTSVSTNITRAPVALDWPSTGTAAVEAVGYSGLLASTDADTGVPIGSIAKTITAMVILTTKPIAAGTNGPKITLTEKDVATYWKVRNNGGSWARAIAGATLTERQGLTAMFLPSANNYAITLSTWAFGSTSAYLAAATTWLRTHELTHTHVADASGLSPKTVSSPHDLIQIGKLLLQDPILAKIVGTQAATEPAAGDLTNTNKLLGIDGIDGIKTGSTDEAGDCLLFSATATIGTHAVRIVGVVLDAPSHPQLWSSVRALLTSVKAGLHDVTVAHAGEVFGTYTTAWGATAGLIASETRKVLVWSDTPISVAVTAKPLEIAPEGLQAGTVTFRHDNETSTVPLTLTAALPAPSAIWRFTNPRVLHTI